MKYIIIIKLSLFEFFTYFDCIFYSQNYIQFSQQASKVQQIHYKIAEKTISATFLNNIVSNNFNIIMGNTHCNTSTSVYYLKKNLLSWDKIEDTEHNSYYLVR